MRLSTDLQEALGAPRSPIATGHARVAELLDRVEETADQGQRIYVLQEVARVCEYEVGDLDMAVLALRSALREDYTHELVASQLERITNMAGAWPTLLPELIAEAKEFAAEQPRTAADVWARIANWYADPLEHLEYAVAAAREALELIPHHVTALATLTGLLRQQGDWIGMVKVATRLAVVEPDAQTRVDLYLSIAGVASTHLQDDERAIDANRAALTVDASCVAALQNLETIYRQRGAARDVLAVLNNRMVNGPGGDTRLTLQLEMARILELEVGDRGQACKTYEAIDAAQTARAVELMKDLAQHTKDHAHQAALHDAIGRFRLHRRDDARQAEWHFAQALSCDDTYLPAMEALAAMYSKRGDWSKAASMYDRARGHTIDHGDQIALALRSAHILLNELNDSDQAAARYADVVDRDPDHIEAALALAELYFAHECWPELAPIVARLRRRADDVEPGHIDEQRLYYLSARCAAGLGNQEQAYDWYCRAHELDPGNALVLRGLADEQFARQNWRRAISLYEDLLADSDTIDGPTRLRFYTALGVASVEAGQFKRARKTFERVLDVSPRNKEALVAVIRCCTELSDYQGVVRATRKLIELSPAEAKLKLLCGLGDLYRDTLGELPNALASYRAALAVCRSDHATLQRVMEVAAKLNQWTVVAEAVERFAELEPDPLRMGQYFLTAAEVYRDKLGDDNSALERYDHALDSFFADPKQLTDAALPRFMKSFADADAIYTRQRAWKEQERAYRRMIRRLPHGHALVAHLWHGLGEIYRSRLRQPDNAIAAFEVARDLEPTNIQRRELLAELYLSAGPDAADKAVAEHQAMLDMYPTKYDSYFQLGRTFMSMGRYDEAWSVCRALVFTGHATAETHRFYDRHNSADLTRAKRRLSPARWKHIYHPDEDRLVSSVMAMVWQDVCAIRAKSPRMLGLRKRDTPSPQQCQTPRLQLVSYAAQALGLRVPTLYVQSQKPGEIRFANCQDNDRVIPALVLRSHYFTLPDHKAAAFVLAKTMCYLRPEHVLAMAFGSVSELQGIFAWAVRRRANNWASHADANLIDELSRSVTPSIGPSRWEQLQRLATRQRRSTPRNLSAWRIAIDHTADRAGFVMCNDLATAATQINAEHPWPGVPEPQTRITALLRYSVSDDYFAVRRHLGLSIGAN